MKAIWILNAFLIPLALWQLGRLVVTWRRYRFQQRAFAATEHCMGTALGVTRGRCAFPLIRFMHHDYKSTCEWPAVPGVAEMVEANLSKPPAWQRDVYLFTATAGHIVAAIPFVDGPRRRHMDASLEKALAYAKETGL